MRVVRFATPLRWSLGLMFRKPAPDTAYLFAFPRDVRYGIHMLFVFFDLGVIWVNDAGQVVDKVLAQPWRLSYAPQAPARYVIELHPSLLDEVQIGEKIVFGERET